MTTQQRQLAILGVLLAVWAGLIGGGLLSPQAPERAPLQNVSGLPQGTSLSSAKGKGEGRTTLLRVNLAQLKQSRVQRAAASPTSKNIFELHRQDGVVVEPPPPPPPEDAPPDIPEASPQQLQAESAWAELGQFRYLGYLELGDNGGKRDEVALLAKRDVLHTVRRGELIGAGILVAAITPNTVVLRHQASQIEQQLTLSDESP